MHTVFSDGLSEPEELIQAIARAGVKTMAITDHDNTASAGRARAAIASLEGNELELISGIEINTYLGPQEVHILGYFIDAEAPLLQDVMARHRTARHHQIQKLVDRIRNSTGVAMTYDEVMDSTLSEGVVGRPHVAQLLVKKGAARNISEAFHKFLSPHCHTYERRDTVTPHEAVEAIDESGGIAVIAHPKEMEGIENLAMDLMNCGLRGLEAYHCSHSPALIEYHCSLAEKLGLIVTGGTDFHGPAENYEKSYKRLCIPPHVYDNFLQEHQRMQQSSFSVS